jgi:solute carrier family 66 (lysosomal lysine-arginine transporter), member 1
MASLVTYLSSSTSARDIPLTTREALSGIFGSISLACWIFLLVPQLLENYRNSSAEAISLAFIFVWFLGDVANLAGALWGGLVPVVVAIGLYFCIADGVLIGQCLYYGLRNRRREARALLGQEAAAAGSASRQMPGQAEDINDEEEPLLKRTRTNSLTIPGSMERRRSSTSLRRRKSSVAAAQNDHLAKILEESDASGARLWFKNAMSILAIGVIGTAGWALAYESGAWKPSPTASDAEPETIPGGALVLGYLSAVAYLGARIPQIIKNAKDKSCEGPSISNLYCWGDQG